MGSEKVIGMIEFPTFANISLGQEDTRFPTEITIV